MMQLNKESTYHDSENSVEIRLKIWCQAINRQCSFLNTPLRSKIKCYKKHTIEKFMPLQTFSNCLCRYFLTCKWGVVCERLIKDILWDIGLLRWLGLRTVEMALSWCSVWHKFDGHWLKSRQFEKLVAVMDQMHLHVIFLVVIWVCKRM